MTDLVSLVERHLNALCAHEDRRPGGPGNLAATNYLRTVLTDLGWQVQCDPLDVLKWQSGPATLLADGAELEVHAGYYSRACNAVAPQVAVATADELEAADCAGKVLLVHGELTREQLIPDSFPFLVFPEHQRIFGLLRGKRPAAILAATGSNPGFAGGLCPFPWIEDGTFEIPTAFCHESLLPQLLNAKNAELRFTSLLTPTRAWQVSATPDSPKSPHTLFTAHIDTKPFTPGALDNATGVVTLLLLAQLLRGTNAPVRLNFINGEDYWDVTGEKLLLRQYEGRWEDVALNVNLDALGARGSRTGYSAFGLDAAAQTRLEQAVVGCPSAELMEPWYAGDHMVFVQQGRPAIAVTSTNFYDLCEHITHTPRDSVDGVDVHLLTEAAECLGRIAL